MNLKLFKGIIAWLALFIITLFLYNLLATKVMFTDVAQYLGVAKEFAGISVSKIRNLPSLTYGWFLGQFLKLSSTLLMAKLINTIWLVFDGLLLFYITRNKKTFLLWIFSPLVWFMSVWINPILPISFFLLLSYYTLTLYEKTQIKKYFIISALSLGLCGALWWAATYLIVFFMLAFFFNKNLKEVIIYSIPLSLAYSIKFLIEYIYLGIPFVSVIRSIGSNFILGMEQPFTVSSYIALFIITLLLISPVLYRLPIKKYKREMVFIGLASLLFFLNLQSRYFIVLLPLIVLFLTENIRKKHLLIHILGSLILIFIFTSSYFGETQDAFIVHDLEKIEKDFPNERFIVGNEMKDEEQAFTLSTLYWGDQTKEFIWYSDYELSLKNESVFKEYSIGTKPKINDVRKIDLKLVYSRTDMETFENVKYLITIDENNAPKGFKLAKTYNLLRVFEKI